MDAGINTTAPLDAQRQLRQLGLDEADLALLRQNGSVHPEFRVRHGRNFGPYYKLRWRKEGRQCVHYLGRDREHARKVALALATWQQASRLEREARAALGQARKALRELKSTLSPALATTGGQWHGYHVRQPRRQR